MKIGPRNFDTVSEEAIRFAESAMRNGWLFEEYIRTAREAWTIAHEDALRQARYQVEQDADK
jgi:hypothetical protein